MRRLLATTMALGLVITAMNFTGIFAVFTDRATTGTNSLESGELARVAHLQIDDAAAGDCNDAVFKDDLTTGLFNATGLLPGQDDDLYSRICLKNAGTAPLAVTASTIDVVETETGCTGDEAAAGDTTCGTENVGDGELGTVLLTQISFFECIEGTDIGGVVTETIEDLAGTPGSLATIQPGEVACVSLSAIYPTQGGFATADQLQQIQSDKVEWRFAFDGTAS